MKKGGRFVAEFGGKGNVDVIVQAVSKVLEEDYGIDATELNPWYFPSLAEYSTLLEQQGFRVRYALHFDRPTQLKDGEKGLDHFLGQFADSFFSSLNDMQRQEVYVKISRKAQDELFYDGHWHIDYKRLRIMAIKP